MTSQQNSIASQFYSNSLSSGMVVTLFAMIFIMIIDRILYSTSVFMAKTDSSSTLHEQAPAAELNTES